MGGVPQGHAERVFDALTRVGTPIIRTKFTQHSAIASTRIGLDVLAHFGIPACEYPIMLIALNPEATRLVSQGLTMEQIQEKARWIPADSPGGPWTIGVGGARPGQLRPNGWAGHLIIASRETGLYADLTADQGSRPLKRIPLSPLWGKITNPKFFDDPTTREAILRPDEVVILLDRGAAQDRDGYLRSPNWHRRTDGPHGEAVFKQITEQVIEAIEETLG